MTPKRIGILVVAYNAASTLATVLDRIPESFRGRITKVLVGDDASQDSTHLVALGYQQLSTDLPLEVIRHPRNLGYGGNQKAGYHWAIDQDLDIVVMLHADGQYAPESLPAMVAPLERDEADAVFGSRMLDEGAARRGGMPLYKYVGNKILTRVENVAAGTSLSRVALGLPGLLGRRPARPSLRPQPRRLRLRHADHRAAGRGREAHRRDPDPHLLRGRDLPRERSRLRPRRHP